MLTTDIISCIILLYKLNLEYFKKEQTDIVNCRDPNKTNLVKELYKRLIVPLYIPILMLVPYFLILSSKERINYNKLKITTFLIGIITIIFSEAIIRFVSKELSENIIIFISPFIIFFIIYFLFFYKLNIKIK